MVDHLRQRQPRVEDKAFLAFVRTRRCCSCGAPPPSQAAHIRTGCLTLGKRSTGMGERPSDRYAAPLCQACHLDGPGAQHKGAEAAFWRRVGIDPFAVAAAFYAEFKGAKPTMEPGIEVEFILQGGRQRAPCPALDPELYVLPKGVSRLKRGVDSGRKVKASRLTERDYFPPAKASESPKRPFQVKRATDSGAKVGRPKRKRPANFTFAADKSKPKRKWLSRRLHGTTRWPKRTLTR